MSIQLLCVKRSADARVLQFGRCGLFALRSLLLGTVLVVGTVSPLQALSVRPPTFEELVSESADIVRAEVVAVEPFRTTSGNGTEVIKTRVTWRVVRTLKGETTEALTLDFLGGRVGAEALDVPGMPQFKVGDQDYLFVEPETRSICPLLAAGHGRYRVQTEGKTGRTYVARDNRVPLVDVSEISRPLTAPAIAPLMARAAQALTPEQFEAAVLATVKKPGGSDAK